MSTTKSGQPEGEDHKQKKIIIGSAATVIFCALFFGAAGSLFWGIGWLFLLVFVGGHAAAEFYIWRINPDLIRRRTRYADDTEDWDKMWLAVFGLLILGTTIMGAVDSGRYDLSGMPMLLWPVGLILFGGHLFVLTWAMSANPHFEKTARIQEDQGHRVIAEGPYAYVRHPGYAAAILGFGLGLPFLLLSWWSFIPALMIAGWLVVRTVLEDRLLQDELQGYQEYAQQVPFLLIPRVW